MKRAAGLCVRHEAAARTLLCVEHEEWAVYPTQAPQEREARGALGIEPGHLRCWPFEKLQPLSALALLVGLVAACFW